jgi:hypothetical protein
LRCACMRACVFGCKYVCENFVCVCAYWLCMCVCVYLCVWLCVLLLQWVRLRQSVLNCSYFWSPRLLAKYPLLNLYLTTYLFYNFLQAFSNFPLRCPRGRGTNVTLT